jgi:hypothetical protein
MIVLFNAYGNHSNRLFQNLHFEAFCYENAIEYFNPTFSDIAYLYKNPVKSKYSLFCSVLRQKPIRKLRKILRFNNIISFNNESENNIQALSVLHGKMKNVYVEGWGFRAYKETQKHYHYFQEKYSLKEEYYSKNIILLQINKLKESGKIIVGIHVRRGDYANFEEGNYFYSDTIYNQIMKKAKTEIKNKLNKDVAFVIFSDENVKFENCIISKNNWYVDHHLMTKCDYLIGPPSTFTLWASYLGEVPYLHVKKDDDINFENFKICKG